LAAGWTRGQIEAKEAAGEHEGTSLPEWLATSQPIPLRSLVLEVLVADGQWREVDTAELAARRLPMLTLPVRNLVQAGPLARMWRRGKHVLTSCRMRYRDGRERYCRVEDAAGARS
jgi:hypothetical protein